MYLAPPVEKDGFAFVADALYAQASNYSSHPRASTSELKEVFDRKSTITDPPGHWYESQLIHYGLQPSKTKSVAKRRLLEALNRGQLVVPKQIEKLEIELRKHWTKNERQAKKERQNLTSTSAQIEPAKRQVSGRKTAQKSGETKKAGAGMVAAKTPTRKRKLDSRESNNAETMPANKRAATTQPGRAEAKNRGNSSKSVSVGKEKPKGKSVEKTTPIRRAARKSAPSIPTTQTALVPRPRQTARRARPFDPGNRFDSRPPPIPARVDDGHGRLHAEHITREHEYEDEDVSMNEYSYDEDRYSDDGSSNDGYAYGTEDPRDSGTDHPLAPEPDADPFTATYNVTTSISDEWSAYSDHKCTVQLRHDRGVLWGAYDLGMFEGVFRSLRPPDDGSYGGVAEISWRGRENSEGVISWDDRRQAGRIEWSEDEGLVGGELYGLYGDVVSFEVYHADRSFCNWTIEGMRGAWEGYSEREYELARVNRWW